MYKYLKSWDTVFLNLKGNLNQIKQKTLKEGFQSMKSSMDPSPKKNICNCWKLLSKSI